MKVLVSGGSGFIGSAIVRAALNRGWQVGAVAGRGGPKGAVPQVEWRSLESWRTASPKFDVLIHAAALRHRHGIDPAEYERANVALTREVLELARERAGRFVEISSIAVYGWPKELPIDETFPSAPVNRYGASKVACEQLVRASGLPFTIVQPSITYGPGDTNGMMDKILRMVARGFFVVPGLGRTRVQLVYVEDLARLVLDASGSESTLGQTFICTYRDPIRVADLVRLVSRTVGRWVPTVGPPKRLLSAAAVGMEWLEARGLLGGKEPPVTREKLATISVDRAYRIDRMRQLLGTEPRVGYEEGIVKTARALGLA